MPNSARFGIGCKLSVEDQDNLIKAAFEGREHAYSSPGRPPFRVGSALLTSGKIIIKGASVDSASSGKSFSVDPTAMVKAVSEGHSAFLAIAIVRHASTPISPCGLCRQVLKEFCLPEMPVIMAPADYNVRQGGGGEASGVKTVTLGELCPLSSFPTARPGQVI
ncbi:hypothetical protein FOMPIDRAFT_1133459 [Fomitopsis schrenkii]|uniref:CMP/dCMP-type deaminase domain-containing protein n=1 Tax=Fomitopsis schrenkii TaxID=2126942 RepID=S8DUH3_FOMSC|nr:hypothetical protein FOMPIDRAFT_1133459 [Fomitopsis schrenkii]